MMMNHHQGLIGSHLVPIRDCQMDSMMRQGAGFFEDTIRFSHFSEQ